MTLVFPFQGPSSETWKTRTRTTVIKITAGEIAVGVVGMGTCIAFTRCWGLLSVLYIHKFILKITL